MNRPRVATFKPGGAHSPLPRHVDDSRVDTQPDNKPLIKRKARTMPTTQPRKSPSNGGNVTTKKTTRRPSSADKHPLAHLVPDPSFAEIYVGRTIDGVEDKALVRTAHVEKQNMLIEGPTGPGKTSLVYAVAAEDKRPLGCVSCNGAVDPRELLGGWVPTETAGQLVWQDGLVAQLARHGGILYLDEVNFLPPRIASVLHPALDRRRQITLMDHHNEVINAHPDFQVIAAYNEGYEDTRPLNKAFRNRFAYKISWGYDPTVEAELVASKTLLSIAESLRARFDAGDLSTPISTNMLQEMELLAELHSPEWAISNFVNAFARDEREAVRMALEANIERLVDELNGYEWVEVYEEDVDDSATNNDTTALEV